MENTNIAPTVPDVSVSNNSDSRNPRMAGFFDRLIALIIDSIIISAVTVPVGFILGSFNDSDLGVYFGSGIGLITSFVYFGYFYTTRGQSIGKIVMKVKVVRSADLKYLSWGEVFMRDILGKIVSGLLLDLGYLWYFMSEKRQTWHDSIASTYVVKTDENGNLLMDGLASYKKEPVKTFGCCALMGLLIAGILALMIYAFAAVLNNLNTSDIDLDGYMQQDFQFEGEEMLPPSTDNEEELRRYLQENFPEEFDNMQDFEPENTPQDETQTL